MENSLSQLQVIRVTNYLSFHRFEFYLIAFHVIDLNFVMVNHVSTLQNYSPFINGKDEKVESNISGLHGSVILSGNVRRMKRSHY